MNLALGAFALRQMLASTVVLGPLLLLIGISFCYFRQDKKSVRFYVIAGIIFSIIGMTVVYSGYHLEPMQAERNQRAESLAAEPARK